MLYLFTAFCLAFVITDYTIPPILQIARKYRLFDEPETNSSHRHATPRLGGIGIFAGFLTTSLFFLPVDDVGGARYVLGCFLLIFLIGVRDDLDNITAMHKLLAQLVMALLLVLLADVRLESLHGMLGWSSDMPYLLSVILSAATILLIVNAFNLVDGINGLCAGLGIVTLLFFGAWMYLTDQTAYALFAVAGVGVYGAFIRFNLMRHARTFMGDSGSLLLGGILAVLALTFIESNAALAGSNVLQMPAAPVVAMSALSIPLFDSLRVFAIRLYRKLKPMMRDRRHLHHLMIDYGWSHTQTTGILVAYNLLLFNLALIGQYYLEQHLLLLLILLALLLPTYFLHEAVQKKKTIQSILEESVEKTEPLSAPKKKLKDPVY